MPSVAAITLDDGQATPVEHTFVPLGPDKSGVWWFEDQSAASAVGYNRISLSLTRPSPVLQPGESSQGRVSRVKAAIHVPVLANVTNSTVSGVEPAPEVAFVERFSCDFILPERASSANRKDILAFAAGLMNESVITTMVTDLQNIY
jgi:hypothetical protein